jgi:protein translocase SecG subunit
LQNKSAGLSNVFGGGGVTTTRRGMDKWLFYATIVCGIIFVSLSIVILVLNK